MSRSSNLFQHRNVSRLTQRFVTGFQSRGKRRKKTAADTLLTYDSLEPKRALSATLPVFINGQLDMGGRPGMFPYGASNTFKLQSRPSATKTIYLDFTGHSSYNNDYGHSIQFPRYDLDGNPNSFSNHELGQIQSVFQNVVEDFLPFNVNVTTRAPGSGDLIRSHSGDHRFGIRVVMTQPTNGFGDGIGGRAFDNSFNDNRDTPAFVFAKGDNVAAIVASHEAGHSLGLSHDGYFSQEYYNGHGSGETSWGPILGTPYTRNVTQWSNGDYTGATNRQDDLEVITRSSNGFGFRSDDVGNQFSTADTLRLTRGRTHVSDWGIISKRNDVDFFRFNLEYTSDVSMDISNFGLNPNLDIAIRLFDSNHNEILSRSPNVTLDAAFNQRLDAGAYYLSIDGVGKPGSYSDYGSLGFYQIEGEIETVVESEVGESGVIRNLDHGWQTIQFRNQYTDPVVVVGSASTNGPDPATVRVRNVTANSFQVRIEEWDYLDDFHSVENVGFMVVEAGRHVLQDGTIIVARQAMVNHEFRQISFGMDFDSRPVVIAQTMTTHDSSAVSVRIKQVTRGHFNLRIQEQEFSNIHHSSEAVGIIAIEKGRSDTNLRIDAFTTGRQVDHNLHQINFGEAFETAPVFLANMQTFHGNNSARLRHRQIETGSVKLFVEEEQSHDNEQWHALETVGYIALNQGRIFAIGASLNRPAPPDVPGSDDLLFNDESNSEPNLLYKSKVVLAPEETLLIDSVFENYRVPQVPIIESGKA